MGNEASTQQGGGDGGEGENEATKAARLRSIQRMDASLRRKLKGGVSYNMKIVLRGERGSGKTALLRRLQGQGFVTEVRRRLVETYHHHHRTLVLVVVLVVVEESIVSCSSTPYHALSLSPW